MNTTAMRILLMHCVALTMENVTRARPQLELIRRGVAGGGESQSLKGCFNSKTRTHTGPRSETLEKIIYMFVLWNCSCKVKFTASSTTRSSIHVRLRFMGVFFLPPFFTFNALLLVCLREHHAAT